MIFFVVRAYRKGLQKKGKWRKTGLHFSKNPEQHKTNISRHNTAEEKLFSFKYLQKHISLWQVKWNQQNAIPPLTSLSPGLDPLLSLWGVPTWYFQIWTVVSPEAVQARFSWGWKDKAFTEPLWPTYLCSSCAESASHTHAVPSMNVVRREEWRREERIRRTGLKLQHLILVISIGKAKQAPQ